MTKIDMDVVAEAIDLHDQGKLSEAYSVLGQAGDGYAKWAAKIVAEDSTVLQPPYVIGDSLPGFGDFVRWTVINLWENEVPGSVSTKWHDVAFDHQENYLELLAESEGELPKSKPIEESYEDALEANGLPPSMAIDIVINTAFQSVSGEPVWAAMLSLDPERWSDETIVLEGVSSGDAFGALFDAGVDALSDAYWSVVWDIPIIIKRASDIWQEAVRAIAEEKTKQQEVANVGGHHDPGGPGSDGDDVGGASVNSGGPGFRDGNNSLGGGDDGLSGGGFGGAGNSSGGSSGTPVIFVNDPNDAPTGWSPDPSIPGTGMGFVPADDDPMSSDSSPFNPDTSWDDFDWSSNEDFAPPIILDLNGDGISIAKLSDSTQFIDMDNDGLANRTAWAGAGDGVLFYDEDGDGTISQAKEFIFTEWDPTATTDLDALRAYFDVNGDGVLDANDTEASSGKDFSKFKVLMTNADGSTTVLALSDDDSDPDNDLGITSIDLTGDTTRTELPDGTVINAQTTFTYSNGTTGTAADTSLAYETDNNRVDQVESFDANGVRTEVSTGYNADGSIDFEVTSITSADGSSITNLWDEDGDGVVDLIQTIETLVDGSGQTIETVTNKSGSDPATAIVDVACPHRVVRFDC